MIKLNYDTLFSITMQHDYLEGLCFDMAIHPTENCAKNLANYGLLFKPQSGGGSILFSRNERKEIQRKIESLTSFQFLLTLRNPAFENYTNLPYSQDKLGKKFFYFTNVSNTDVLDSTTNLARSTDNKIGDKDYGWLVNSTLLLPLAGNFTKVDLSQIKPGSGKQLIKSFVTTGLQNLVINLANIDDSPNPPIQLSTGNYILDFEGASPKATQLYFDNSLWKTNAWGLIEITKDKTVDYTAQTAYTLTARANPWSYYLIDPANKVTVNNNALANLSTTTTGLAGLALSWVQEADMETDSYEQRQYALLKQRNAGKGLFLLRSNRAMPKSAESTVSVKLTLDGVQRTLPSPIGTQSKSDSIQTL